MNELERLIAALPRSEPSENLDERIGALLAHQPVRSLIHRWNGKLAWIATAACVGAIGFYLGRQSVVVVTVPTTLTAAAPTADLPLGVAPVATHVTSVPLGADQLAKLFVSPASREGMFGKGPVTIEVSPPR
jgi:hypothetical protein